MFEDNEAVRVLSVSYESSISSAVHSQDNKSEKIEMLVCQ